MKKGRRKFRQQAALLVTVLLIDGGLFGTMAGVMRTDKRHVPADNQTSIYRDIHQTEAEFRIEKEKTAEERKEAGGQEAETCEQKVVALTFDDGPHEEYTVRLLDGLKERGVKATFFLMGQNIEGNEEVVRRMQKEGHLIGNHSYRHVQLTGAGEDAVCEAVEQTEEMIEKITGIRPQYLRPPYGDWNDRLECRVDLITVFWTVDSLDWKLKDTAQIVRRVEKKLGDGDIILMHDIFPTSVEAALTLVDRLREKGYSFVTVEELLID